MKERIDQAKSVSLEAVLTDLGYKPTTITESKLWFTSPFREEEVASFILYPRNNSWFDWGEKTGGDVIEFIKIYKKCKFSEAIDFLIGGEVKRENHRPPKDYDPSKEGIEILDVKEITNPHLLAYAYSRGISERVLLKHCKEVDFCFRKFDHVTQTAIGFRSENGGFELRSPSKKVCNTPKSWTAVRGTGDTMECDVFEGFFDFMSHLELIGLDMPINDTFILNGLVYAAMIVDDVKEFRKCNLYLDNGAAADKTIEEYFIGENFIDKREIFFGYGDYNDYVRAQLNK